ncbi:hypothetical protein B0T09DRAFT_266247 [Sordaria sp. MPI-SDFR-AT-0083]|nr:hypothetical protein B0T09DRAFT_266247 [Sordaria sp. MPI-SDFR-AT-0083]
MPRVTFRSTTPSRGSINTNGDVRLILSMEKSIGKGVPTQRRNRVWTLWNWIIRRKPLQQQERPSTPDTGDLVIKYPVEGTYLPHLRFMKRDIAWNKRKHTDIVEYMDSQRLRTVKIKGIPVQSVLTLSDGYKVTTTNPEDAELLGKIIGCGVVQGSALERIPLIMPKDSWVNFFEYKIAILPSKRSRFQPEQLDEDLGEHSRTY